ncbi:hypothetical protein [Catenuloplanes indicus]|uniref:Uncharacterized protein n=1 Tax=Catenuloplanes indicus TaxID=137267 RepID=A0AAE4AYC8_9ACTN|nr:hypothetical protein [Catenuloplanes indicus]MDQ0367980.1 hypothetical protein [Catenuloplanes indicus]
MKTWRIATGIVTVAILGLGSSPAVAGVSSSDGRWTSAILESSESIFGGSAVRLRYSNGVTAITQPGTRVTFGESPSLAEDGKGAAIDRWAELAMQMAEPADDAAQKYRESGRSIFADALAAGFPVAEARREQERLDVEAKALDNPDIINSECLYAEDHLPDDRYEWWGCRAMYATPDQDPNNWYSANSSLAHGWGTGVLGGGAELQRGYTQFQFTVDNNNGDLIEFTPQSSINGQNCNVITLGLSYVVEVNVSTQLCDNGWTVTANQLFHKTEWYGASTGGPSDSRHAANAVTLRAANASSSSLAWRIGWRIVCLPGPCM